MGVDPNKRDTVLSNIFWHEEAREYLMLSGIDNPSDSLIERTIEELRDAEHC